MRVRRMFGVASLLLCFLALAKLAPCGSVLLVYNTGQHPAATTRFEDVPAKKGFGPRVPEEGFAGRLSIATPDIYACSPLDGPVTAAAAALAADDTSAAATSTGEPVYSSSAPATTTPTTARVRTGGGVASRRGWGRLHGDGDGDAASRQRRHHPLGGEILEGEGEQGEGEGEELPSAVLISRSIKHDPAACYFETKVLNAQAAGFSAVIVYDVDQEAMFQMSRSSKKGPQHSPVEIPLVLVTHASGLALQTLIAATADPRGPEIYLDNADPFGVFVTVNLTMFMVVTGFMLALLTCGSMMVVTLHRYLRRYESLVASTNRPMSLPEVLQLPEVCVEAGSRLEGDSCPVCLETYRLGDKLRNLPCQHAFHAGCITPWLTQRQRTCPMCKDPITIRPAVAAAAAAAPSASASPSSSASPPSAVLSAPLVSRETPSVAGGDAAGRGGGGSGGDGGGAGGDRLPLLSNSRGVPSDGGSIQETPPV